MKIDIHVHTKKTKLGDAETRNIDVDKFEDIIKSTEVKILAITNHNHFDLEQYEQFTYRLCGICKIWPGIELDIIENNKRSHLIVVVNPKKSKEFSEIVETLLEKKTPDNFSISIKDTIDKFDRLSPIYIPHYLGKKPNLGDEEVELLINLVENKKRVLKEATNSISAGIYISHGHNSIYGSDIHDWDKYSEESRKLPDLRLPVESYEQFCLLLEKDDNTIQTILNKKEKEVVQLKPFTAEERINLEIYNDINIIFGSKGTGKTEILKALSKYYNEKGYKTSVYESNSTHLDDVYGIKEGSIDLKIEELGIEDCKDEFKIIRESIEYEITSISKYTQYFSLEYTNKIVNKIAIKDFQQADNTQSIRSFNDIISINNQFNTFCNFVFENTILENTIGKEDFEDLTGILKKLLIKLKLESEVRFIESKSISMLNKLIEIFVSEIAKKTGRPAKPVKTGFQQYASNRITIERAIKKILTNIEKKINPLIQNVGNLGEKGSLYCKTNICIQNGTTTDRKLASIIKGSKIVQKDVAKSLKVISNCVYSTNLFEEITKLKEIERGNIIESIRELIIFNKYFVINDKEYAPSNGESSMILLHKELEEEKEIYLIDEPEKSLGNDYINDVIVPILKKRAQQGKKIIIATHDANIAVRTLPYASIYRLHDLSRYYTFIGNPYTNNLVCIDGDKSSLDWKNISMKTLEGGRNAFGERGGIYGNF